MRTVQLRVPAGGAVFGKFAGVIGCLPCDGSLEPVYGFIPDINPSEIFAVKAEDFVELPRGD